MTDIARLRRDRDWPYTVELFDKDDNLLIATRHRTKHSAQIEGDVCRRRTVKPSDPAHRFVVVGPDINVTWPKA